MKQHQTAPRITHLEWGQVKVAGQGGTYKDAKLFPGGSRAWDWNETGTRHEPGIQPADVEELLAHEVSVVILSQGFNRRLQVSPETLQLLREKNISSHVLQTEEAVRLYNQLREKERVGALIHSTC